MTQLGNSILRKTKNILSGWSIVSTIIARDKVGKWQVAVRVTQATGFITPS